MPPAAAESVAFSGEHIALRRGGKLLWREKHREE
jgi:hypothetical protein